MKFSNRFLTALSACIVLSISSGCVSTDNAIQGARLNSSEAKQFRKAQTKTRVGGIATYAVIGAALGYAVGGSRGAYVGAAIGGIKGAEAGERKAQNQGGMLVRNRSADRQIRSLTAQNQRLRSQISSMNAKRKEYSSRIAKAKASGDKKALASIKREINSSMRGADRSISSGERSVRSSSSSGSSRLRSEASSLNSSVKGLQQERKLMAGLYNSIDV